MKLAILGGGGFRTPFIYQALLRDQGAQRITEVSLLDNDESRLHTMTGILSNLAIAFADAPRLTATTDAREAIAGSDFVFAAIRVGGLHGRQCDEHVALDLGVLGQETTGAGGLAYALRTVPVMLDYARMIKELAPSAYVLNFTNPAGIITEAMQAVLGDRVLGICDTPSGLGRRVAAILGLDHQRVQMDYLGLNHLGWMRRLLYDGVDLLPALIGNDEQLQALEEGHIFGTEWVRSLGAIPNEYLYYYYFNREAVANIRSSKLTRGDYLARTQKEFFDGVSADPDDAVSRWRRTVQDRSASYMAEAKGGTQGRPGIEFEEETDPSQQGYAGVAVAVMRAISRNERATMILNVRNRGTIASLPWNAVVEVPTTVDANGVHPLSTEQPNLAQSGLMQRVKAVEQHTIAAAVHGDASEALKAFALHPLVDSVSVARELLAGYRDRIPELASVLRG